MTPPADSGRAALGGGFVAAEHLPLWAWFVFAAALVALLGIDLFLHRGSRLRSRTAAICSSSWV